MTARTFGDDDDMVVGNGVGVRPTIARQFAYDLAVVCVDVADTVRSAGGWMCDRSRAGWKVTVLMADCVDVRPLHILGLATEPLDRDGDALQAAPPAALAVAADVVTADERMRRYVLRALEGGTTEVTLWGERALAELDRRVERVQHRLSAAARAFKTSALLAAACDGRPQTATGGVEQFRSCALWYPPDGSDLRPVS